MARKPKQPARRAPPAFTPVATRRRRDGWTPERQADFIAALAASGCVTEACESVGVGTSSAYALRARLDAQSFRVAWDAAQDHAIRRLSDAALSRAIHGEVVPHYYKGERVGEHRRYDNRLTQFLLRYRDPARYGRWLDQMQAETDSERITLDLDRTRTRCRTHPEGFDPRVAPARPTMVTPMVEVEASQRAIMERAYAMRDEAQREAERIEDEVARLRFKNLMDEVNLEAGILPRDDGPSASCDDDDGVSPAPT